jgi:hypothetical protein
VREWTNPSDIIMNANIQIFDGIKTTKIHEILINSSIDLISPIIQIISMLLDYVATIIENKSLEYSKTKICQPLNP